MTETENYTPTDLMPKTDKQLYQFLVLHNIPYLNDPSKAEQAQPGSRLVLSGSRLREMNLYSEMVRDTSINAVSTPKYHPLPACSRPTEGLAGFFSPLRR